MATGRSLCNKEVTHYFCSQEVSGLEQQRVSSRVTHREKGLLRGDLIPFQGSYSGLVSIEKLLFKNI